MRPQLSLEPADGVHVCFFTDSLEPSGVGVHLLNLMRWLDPARFRMSLVCPDTEGGRRLMGRAARLGAEVYPLTVREEEGQAPVERLMALLQEECIHLFHSQAGISWEGLLGLRTAYRAGVPVRVVTEHLPYLLTHPGQVADHREAIRLADRVITVSEGSRRTFLARGYPAEQFICIHNGIEPPRPCRPGESRCTRQALGLGPETPLLLTVARMTAQKGHDLLLAAAPRILVDYPQACLGWVGEGPERSRLERRAHELGVAGAVHFLGHRDDVPALMAAADLFVLPSRFEGHPLVVLEAMACGLAVVGTRVCGLDEAVVDGETGLLVEPDQTDALAAAVVALLSSPARRRRMGRAGRRLVRQRFHARTMAAATVALYEELLASKRGEGTLRAQPPAIAAACPGWWAGRRGSGDNRP
jgi:glycosyltransferase involved in cell wall biosynthesis